MAKRNQYLSLEEGLAEKAHKRQEANTYRYDDFPELKEIDTKTFLGSFSWFTPAWHIRFIDSNGVYNVGYGDQTAPEIARDYIAVKYGRSPAVKKFQLPELQRERNAPLLSMPGVYPDMCYIDIKSAYWSIIRIIGWDVDYMPGEWLSIRSNNEDFPGKDVKVARSSLVSLCQSQMMSMWDGHRLYSEKSTSNIFNSALWACVFDVLNGVADDMVCMGAKYVHTDGYIIERSKADEAIAKIREWGLSASIKYEGDSEITTVGCYRVGGVQTQQRTAIAPQVWYKVDARHKEWLKPRVKWFAEYRIDKEGVALL